jgi:hypothetical protein
LPPREDKPVGSFFLPALLDEGLGTVSHSCATTNDRCIDVSPITSADVARVAQFLHDEMNGRISPATWAAALRSSWQPVSPNHGFMLVCGDQVLGVYLAFYSQRVVDGRIEKFCNMGAWCVVEGHRSQSLRLLRAMLNQEGHTFTDLSPSGNVVPLNARLNFQHLDTSTALGPNLPWPSWATRTRVSGDPAVLLACLKGRDLEIYRDHARAPAAHHLLVRRGDEWCYVMFRRDRRKNLPLFATILHVGNPELFRRTARHFYSHLLTRFGIPATFAEKRVVVHRPRFSVELRSPRPKMFRSNRLKPSQVDYLYSELTCVPW